MNHGTFFSQRCLIKNMANQQGVFSIFNSWLKEVLLVDKKISWLFEKRF